MVSHSLPALLLASPHTPIRLHSPYGIDTPHTKLSQSTRQPVNGSLCGRRQRISILQVHVQRLRYRHHVLITPAAHVHENQRFGRGRLGELHHVVDGVRGLQRGDDALIAGEGLQRGEI